MGGASAEVSETLAQDPAYRPTLWPIDDEHQAVTIASHLRPCCTWAFSLANCEHGNATPRGL
jgi:hypothetical protein